MITEIMHMDNGYDDLSPNDRKKQRHHLQSGRNSQSKQS